MKNLDVRKISRVVLYALLVVGIISVVLPIIVGACYTYPCEDDFSWELGGRVNSEKYGGFLGGIAGAVKYYIGVQGTYLANFLWHYIRPYGRGGMFGVHVVMFILVVLLVFSVFFMVKSMVKGKAHVLFLTLISYVIMFNTASLGTEKEFLYWYTGNINYALGMSLACIALGFALHVKREGNVEKARQFAIIGAFVGFLASGCSLQITSFNCSWLLLMIVLCFEEVLKRKIIALPFVGAFVGALINACAPGYLNRIDMVSTGEKYGILHALKDTLTCWKNEWDVIVGNEFFLIVLVVAFLICYLCEIKVFSEGITTVKMVILFPAIFLIQFFAAFPVVFGYQSSNLSFSRTICTQEILTKLTLLFLVIVLAQWLRECGKLLSVLSCGIVIVLGILLIFNGDILSDIKQGYSYNVAKELKEGRLQELCEFRGNVLKALEKSEKDTDVYLRVPNIPHSNVMYSMGITTDPSSCNDHVAMYFGFKSVAIEYSDEYEFTSQ